MNIRKKGTVPHCHQMLALSDVDSKRELSFDYFKILQCPLSMSISPSRPSVRWTSWSRFICLDVSVTMVCMLFLHGVYTLTKMEMETETLKIVFKCHLEITCTSFPCSIGLISINTWLYLKLQRWFLPITTYNLKINFYQDKQGLFACLLFFVVVVALALFDYYFLSLWIYCLKELSILNLTSAGFQAQFCHFYQRNGHFISLILSLNKNEQNF